MTTPDPAVSPVPDADGLRDGKLWSVLDWSLWGNGLGDVLRTAMADAMVAALTDEQRAQAEACIKSWHERRSPSMAVGVGTHLQQERDALKDEVQRLKEYLLARRNALADLLGQPAAKEDTGWFELCSQVAEREASLRADMSIRYQALANALRLPHTADEVAGYYEAVEVVATMRADLAKLRAGIENEARAHVVTRADRDALRADLEQARAEIERLTGELLMVPRANDTVIAEVVEAVLAAGNWNAGIDAARKVFRERAELARASAEATLTLPDDAEQQIAEWLTGRFPNSLDGSKHRTAARGVLKLVRSWLSTPTTDPAPAAEDVLWRDRDGAIWREGKNDTVQLFEHKGQRPTFRCPWAPRTEVDKLYGPLTRYAPAAPQVTAEPAEQARVMLCTKCGTYTATEPGDTCPNDGTPLYPPGPAAREAATAHPDTTEEA